MTIALRPQLTLRDKGLRALWQLAWLFLFRPTPRPLHAWRAFLLRSFGSKVGRSAHIYPSARVWAPWNLSIGNYSTLADGVDCYCVDKVTIGSYSTVSQYSYLCTASHDYLDPAIMTQPQMPLLTGPINIGDRVWVTTDVFVAPGVTISDGAVVLARSSVLDDIPPWTVAAGQPAKVVRDRVLRSRS